MPQINAVVNEINYVFELPSPDAATLNEMIKEKDKVWLQKELNHEKLRDFDIVCKAEETSDQSTTRYASESIVDLNAKMELFKYRHSLRKKKSTTMGDCTKLRIRASQSMLAIPKNRLICGFLIVCKHVYLFNK